MPSALSLQKPRPGIGIVVLVDGAIVVLLGLGVAVEGVTVEVDAPVVKAGLLVVLVTLGVLVVVDGTGGISLTSEKHRKTTYNQKVNFVRIRHA